MSIDLTAYITDLQAEVDAPGVNSYPNAQDDDWIARMLNAFWSCRLDGLIQNYTCDVNGTVSPINPTPQPSFPGDPSQSADLEDRELVQLVIFYAAAQILRGTLRTLQTMFSATAGPVKYEVQQSANVLNSLLKDIQERKNIILTRLSNVGTVPSYLTDAIIARDESLRLQETWWVGAGGEMTNPTAGSGWD